MATDHPKGNTIKAYRILAGKSQDECAAAIRVTRPNYCRRENGKTKISHLELAALANLFGVSADALLGQQHQLAVPKAEPNYKVFTEIAWS